MQISDIFTRQYKDAAGEGAVLELRLRLIAGKIPVLQEQAVKMNLENIETGIAEHFGNLISDKEKETLKLCRQLRNKVLHCDFREARNRLEKLTGEKRLGAVKKIDISGLSSASVVEKIGDVQAGCSGTFDYVADTDPSGVYGWLLELGTAGDFCKAVDVFKAATAIIERLARIDMPVQRSQ